MRGFRFPAPVYPIADADAGGGRSALDLLESFLAGGAPLVQLRVKRGPVREFVELARAARRRTERAGAALIINDRADIAVLVGADGVHLGQDDLPPEAARALLGAERIVGFSTHNLEQAQAAARAGAADYIGFGPIFATGSKANPDPVVGVTGLAAARAAVALPIVAIGGIREERIVEVRAAGADAVAIIADLATAPDPAAKLRRLLARAPA